ncbi:glycosyltransferase [Methylorubrum sp. SB2]|uniref:glycosyltransferase n=1 Tax=Methylorubrum subtropicum TaxID=3138812 RepID=UPI00313EC8A1
MADHAVAMPEALRDCSQGGLDAWVESLRRPFQSADLASALQRLLANRDLYSILRLAFALKVRGIALPDYGHFTLGLYQARALMVLSLPRQAIDVLTEVMPRAARASSDTEQADLSILLARCQLKAGQVEAGFETLAEAERRWPDDHRIVFARLEILARSDHKEALALLRRLEADPVRAAGLSHRRVLVGDVLIGAGLADEIPVEALAKTADTLSALHALVNAYAGRGDRVAWAEALTRYLKRVSHSDAGVCAPVNAHILQAFRREGPSNPPPVTPVARLAVIMCVHNAADTLATAIASVLAQTYASLRLVIVDDGSTDGSGAVMRAIATTDPRISIIESPVNQGVYRSKNLALRLVAAEFYTFHDADDWMHPERLERAMALIDADARTICVYSRWVRIDRNGRLESAPLLNRASSLFACSVLDAVGHFDGVRFSGDAEFEWRLRAHYGSAAIAVSPDVMTVGLRLPTSLTTAPDTGIDAFGGNASRAAYADGFVRWHLEAQTLRMPADTDGAPRAFPAPPDMTAPPSGEEGADPFAHACTVAAERGEAPVLACWPANLPVTRNRGDKLNAALVAVLAERQVINSQHSDAAELAPIYHAFGSGIRTAHPEAVVWGGGFIGSTDALRIPVANILAVRGPLTARRIVEAGGEAGLPMGDPALLLPLFYAPDIASCYDIGIIQHGCEAGTEPLPRLPAGLSVRLIDITGGIKPVIDAVLSCRRILSSSLHGLIVSHAYGIPATWLKICDRPLDDDFEFNDYWASIGRADVSPIEARNGALIDPEAGISTPGEALIDLFALLDACPFIDEPRRQTLIARAKARESDHTVLGWHGGLRSGTQARLGPGHGRCDG